MTQHSGEEGVSEVVGVVLLVGLTVLAVAIVATIFLSSSQPGEIPHAVIITGIDESGHLTLLHEGGDPLRPGEYRVYVDTNNILVDETGNFTEPEGGVWSVGENITYKFAAKPDRVVVTTVSGGSQTIVAESAFPKNSARFSPDPVEPGLVVSGGESISITLPIETKEDLSLEVGFEGDGSYSFPVSAKVTGDSVARVDFTMYGYIAGSLKYVDNQRSVEPDGDVTYTASLGNIPNGGITGEVFVVVVAIATDETGFVLGCDAQYRTILESGETLEI